MMNQHMTSSFLTIIQSPPSNSLTLDATQNESLAFPMVNYRHLLQNTRNTTHTFTVDKFATKIGDRLTSPLKLTPRPARSKFLAASTFIRLI